MRTIFYHSFVLLLVCWTVCEAAAPKDPAPAKVKPRSLIPFPRVGRSRSAAQSTPQATNTFSQSAGRERSGLREFKRHLIPFPRVGKRQSLIPFPRVGRSHQYVNYPVDEASPEAGNSPDVDTGMFVGSENDIMVPVFNIQGLGDHPVYGQLRWQQNSQELED